MSVVHDRRFAARAAAASRSDDERVQALEAELGAPVDGTAPLHARLQAIEAEMSYVRRATLDRDIELHLLLKHFDVRPSFLLRALRGTASNAAERDAVRRLAALMNQPAP